jgi:hypothetical protein
MANMIDSILRNLQRFFEYDLMGIVKWDTVRVFIPKDDNDEQQAAGVRFQLADKDYEILVESSDVNPKYNCGSVFLNDKRIGPIDEKTWTAMALEIKKHNTRAVA